MNYEKKDLEFEDNYLWIQSLIGANSLIDVQQRFSHLPADEKCGAIAHQMRGIGQLVLEDFLDYTLAEESFTKSIKLNPRDSNSYALRALVKLRTNRPDEAIIDLRKSKGLLGLYNFDIGGRGPIFHENLEEAIKGNYRPMAEIEMPRSNHRSLITIIAVLIGAMFELVITFFKKPIAWVLSAVGALAIYAVPILNYLNIEPNAIYNAIKVFLFGSE